MGEPAVPTETERAIALGIAERILDEIRCDEPMRPLTVQERWLLASTLKHHAEAIANYLNSLLPGKPR